MGVTAIVDCIGRPEAALDPLIHFPIRPIRSMGGATRSCRPEFNQSKDETMDTNQPA